MKLNLTAFGVAWLMTTLVVSMGMMGVGVLYAQHKKAQVRRGWVLTPAVAAARSLKSGTVLTPEDVVVKDVPEQFITSSIFKGSELPSVFGRTLLDPLEKDDTLMRWHLESPPPTAFCLQKIAAMAADAGVVADPDVKRALDALIVEAGTGRSDGH